MNYEEMTMQERANLCQNIYQDSGEAETPKCSDIFLDTPQCGSICCGHCPKYTGCVEAKCEKVWIDPRTIIDNPVGRLIYVELESGRLVSGSIPCIISEMYDDNE